MNSLDGVQTLIWKFHLESFPDGEFISMQFRTLPRYFDGKSAPLLVRHLTAVETSLSLHATTVKSFLFHSPNKISLQHAGENLMLFSIICELKKLLNSCSASFHEQNFFERHFHVFRT